MNMEGHKKRVKVAPGDVNIQSSIDNKRDDRYSNDGHGHSHGYGLKANKSHLHDTLHHSGNGRQNQVGTVMLFGVPIVSLVMEGKERLCLAQISSTLLKEFSYNEIHNRRVALGITCIQCTPVQLEILRRAGAMPVTSRRCGMITRREAERLCQSFLGDHAPPQLPENFAFNVYHECAWGCRGAFVPARYNSSRAKCIRCSFCQLFFSPNKFIFHSHRLPDSNYVQPDAANFNSWRRHLKLCGDSAEDANSGTPHSTSYPPVVIPQSRKDGIPISVAGSNKESAMVTAQIVHAWEDVKAMFNGGTRKRLLAAQCTPTSTGLMKNSSTSSKLNQNQTSGSNNHRHGSSSSSAVTPQSSRQTHFLHHMNNSPNIPSCNPIGSTPPAFMSPVLPVTSPLLSPGSIWNPGISPPSVGNCNVVPTMPLSIHPLSIPWLRRPLFPFSHPFGPTCKFLGGDTVTGGTCVGESCGGVNSSSAFKPVAVGINNRSQSTSAAEHLFSTWLNNSVNMSASVNSIPEDLSVNSSIGSCTPTPSPLIDPNDSEIQPHTSSRKHSKEFGNSGPIKVVSTSSNIDEFSQSSDEENVDIESTETESEKREEQLSLKENNTSQERYFNSSGQVWNKTATTSKQNRLVESEDDSEEEVDILEDGGSNSVSLSVLSHPTSTSTSTSGSCQNNNHSNGSTTRKLMSTMSTAKRPKKRLWDFDRKDD